ncbi:MAG TPA: homoserine dehydrogenase [Caulobacteraceae bacterium]
MSKARSADVTGLVAMDGGLAKLAQGRFRLLRKHDSAKPAIRPMTTWRIGIAGIGTVGGALLKLIQDRPGYVPGCEIRVVGVSARSRHTGRTANIDEYPWFDDPVALASSPDLDMFVELIGGSDGTAKAAVEAALSCGKPVVTANKALIAEHGLELARLAEANNVPLLFEGGVMGGTPAVKILRESLIGAQVDSVSGILNGTCNYILSTMESGGGVFSDVLAEAQRLGYAESDPTMDVGGFDSAHKISILAALAFECAPSYSVVEVEGIQDVDLIDIKLAEEFGYRVRLIASAVRTERGISARVHPMLVSKTNPLASTHGALNALFIKGPRIGEIFILGMGAGGGSTATGVASDIAEVMAGAQRPVFRQPADTLESVAPVDADHQLSKAYIRVMVKDESGAVAAVSEALAESDVSIERMLQKPVSDLDHVPIAITTHETSEKQLLAAVRHIAGLKVVTAIPRMIRIAADDDRSIES